MQTGEVAGGIRDWIAAISALVATVALVFGIVQYVAAQRWRRAEFVAQKLSEFEGNPDVQNALTMMDWSGRTIWLNVGDTATATPVRVTHEALARILVHHSERAFSDTEAAVRDCFDHLLDGLERFEHFIEAGLVTPEEFRPYLGYWTNLMRAPGIAAGNTEASVDWRTSLSRYMEYYEYSGVQRLIQRLRPG